MKKRRRRDAFESGSSPDSRPSRDRFDPFQLDTKDSPLRADPSRRNVMVLSMIAVVVVVVGGLAVTAGRRLELGSLSKRLERYLDPTAKAHYLALSRDRRASLARADLPVITHLRSTGWHPLAVDLRTNTDGGAEQLRYNLKGEKAELRGCRFEQAQEEPRVLCDHLTYTPAFENRIHEVAAPFEILPGRAAEGESVGEIQIAVTETVMTRGRVRVSPDDIRILDGEVRVPSPLADARYVWGPIRELSLVLDAGIVSRAQVGIDLAVPMPGGLNPLMLAHLNARLMVDLRPGSGMFLLEGELKVPGFPAGTVRALYFPNRYASIHLGAIVLAIAPPYLCMRVRSLLLEADVERNEFRLALETELGPVEVLNCTLTSEPTNSSSPKTVVAGFEKQLVDWTRESFRAHGGGSLPSLFQTHGQLVVDGDNGVLCMELGIDETSLLQAAYFFRSKTVVTKAPLQMSSRLASLDDIANLPSVLAQASPSFPPMDLEKCWEGDPGPREDALRAEVDAKARELGW